MSVKKAHFLVDGMTRDHCVRAVTNAIRSVAGVVDVNFSLSAKSADVTFDETRAKPEDIIAAVAEEGYTAKTA